MARARVIAGCPAEGKAIPGRQDTAAHRSPHGRLDRASPRWEKNLFLASRPLSPSPVKRERGWGEGVSGHVEVVEGSSEVKSRTHTRRCAPTSPADGRGAGTPPSFGTASARTSGGAGTSVAIRGIPGDRRSINKKDTETTTES